MLKCWQMLVFLSYCVCVWSVDLYTSYPTIPGVESNPSFTPNRPKVAMKNELINTVKTFSLNLSP